MQKQFANLLAQAGVIPVLVIERVEDAVPLAQALINGGLSVLEITLRTQAALAAVEEIAKQFPQVYVGIGTVLNAADIRRSVEAGAKFMVSPGTTDSLLDAAQDCSIPLLPGASGPSEVMRLYERGYAYQKFFPAEAAGGVAMLKSIGDPLPQVTFCPTGGIGSANAAQYLALANVACVGGSWMAPSKLILEKKWAEITQLAKAAITVEA